MIIRRVPEDFRVEERLTEEAARGIAELPGPGRRFVAYRVTKTSLTTPEASQRLARELKIKSGAVSYAGLKDKHAQTVQHMTADVGRASPLEAPAHVAGPGWSAERVGWTDGSATAGWIAANRFEIVVRGADKGDVRHVRERAARMSGSGEPSTLHLLNLFGEQRFGSARHGEGFAARFLVKGDYESALRLLIGTPARKDSGPRRTFTRVLASKWGRWSEVLAEMPKCAERGAIEALAGGGSFKDAFAALPHFEQTMCVEAYQSWLWNAVAERMASKHASLAALEGIEPPTLGPGLAFEPPWGDAARRVLEAEGVTLEELRLPGLRRPSFGVAARPLVVRATAFRIDGPVPDEFARPRSTKPLAMRLSFELPRGAYATVLLAAFGV